MSVENRERGPNVMLPEPAQFLIEEAMKIPAVTEGLDIWHKGGWAMYALMLNGIIMFSMVVRMMMKLISKGLFISPERSWRKYWRTPDKPKGTAGRIIAGAMSCTSIEEAEHYFEHIKGEEVYPFQRDLPMIKMCVGAAPLLGLLGTVTGMLSTFGALATGGGGDETMGMVAGGISEALITTETGLVLALTGLIFQFTLTHQHEKYGKVVAHLETMCTQHFRRGESAQGAPA